VINPKRLLALLSPDVWMLLLAAASPASAQDHRPSSPDADPTGLSMSRAVVCESIDGFESYKPRGDAALANDEKLLIYFRPFNYQIDPVDQGYEARFSEDAQICKRGVKTPISHKDNIVVFTARSPEPPRFVYLKTAVSLKNLPPGRYNLVLILHDKLAGTTASQIVPFEVIRPGDAAKARVRRRQSPGDAHP
jgi:hypothetical protein